MQILTQSVQALKNLRTEVLTVITLLQQEMVRCDYDEKKLDKLDSRETHGINNHLAEIDLLIQAIDENETSFRISKRITQADYLRDKVKLSKKVRSTAFGAKRWVSSVVEEFCFAEFEDMIPKEEPIEGDYASSFEDFSEIDS